MTITDTDTAAPPDRLPRSYLVWLAGSRASLLGDAALHFALGWAAGVHGGRVAALVLTAITLPRTALLLVGGAVAERFGVRRVLLVGDAVMLAATLLLAPAGHGPERSPWFLVAVAALIGTVDAFYLPASGAMPRRLVGRALLPRALAVQQAGSQVTALLGAPLGALLVTVAGLGGAALVDAASFALVLLVLVRLRPTVDVLPADESLPAPDGRPTAQSLPTAIADGLRLAVRDRTLRPALLLTSAAAASLLPVVSLVSPLLARERGWGAQAAGLVAGGQSAAIIAVSLLIARRGPLRRPGVGACGGLCLAAVGVAGLAAASGATTAVAAGTVLGLGSGLFAAHIGPLVLGRAPESHLARVQSVLTLVQSAALVAANNLLGSIAEARGATMAAAVCAVAAAVSGLAGLASPALRAAEVPVRA
ncbi:MFS transporter [Kitasatospora aureofaciens]|uniref:MFS transporter n=1 Tax=Kitasatospora aureofaciens TaxID=1894 RepID=UPI001C467157|nr:MFS transporter [Kitasatospora aureofaciens]MBV6699831.1 MFS transporter [Kitasatospora aureofaciens]